MRKHLATAFACLFWGTTYGALCGLWFGSPLVGAAIGFISGAAALRSRFRRSGYCLGFGMVYGAVCGAMYAALFPLLEGSSGFYALPDSALAEIGAIFGAISGGLFGLLGSTARGRLGWCLAGMVAGYLIPSLWAPIGPWELSSLQLSTWNGLPALIGGAVGLAVGCGLRGERSRLPGVRRLREVIHEELPSRRQALPQVVAAEVTPSLAPAGRGDEATPAG